MMRNLRWLCLVLTVSFVAVTSALAADPALTPPSPELPASLKQSALQVGESSPSLNRLEILESQRAAAENELKILKEKNILVSEFQGTLISVVFWSLGVVVSVVLLLVGASFITNFKMHEKDLQRVRDDYESKIKVFGSEIDANFSRVSREILEAQDARSQQDLNRVLDQTNQIRAQFEVFRLALEAKVAETSKSAGRAEAIADIVNEKQHSLALEMRRVEAMVWNIRKIPTNVLITYLQALDSALITRNDWDIDDTVKRIIEVLEEFAVEQTPVTKKIEGYIQRRMEKLKAIRPDKVDEIMKTLSSCVFDSSESSEAP